MEKNRNYLFIIFLSVSMFFGLFFYAVLYTNAGNYTGEEVFFTHTHKEGCYQYVSQSCGGNHTRRRVQEYGDYHCQTCGKTTRHNVEADNCSCTVVNTSWQENGFTKCTICGTIHSAWGSPSGNHTYMAKKMTCGMTEGENTTGISITLDDQWTNQDVKLLINKNILKQDITNDNLSYSWGGTERLVGANGTYTVDATNSAGQTITASVAVNCIDKIPPVINLVSGNTVTMTQNAIQVSVEATDSESGLAEMAFSFDGGNSYGSNSFFTVVEGVDITCVIRDKAGNTVSKIIRRSDFAYPPTPTSSAPTASTQPAASTPVSSSDTAAVKESPKTSETITSDSKISKPRDTMKRSEQKKDNSDSTSENTGKNQDTDIKMDLDEDSTSQLYESDNRSKGREGEVTVYRLNQGEEVWTKASQAVMAETSSDDDQMQHHIEDMDTAKSSWPDTFRVFLNRYGWRASGFFLFAVCTIMIIRNLWIQTAFLYCYNGGEEFRKLGLLRLKKNKREFTLFLPDYLLNEAETPRYRLLIHKCLVKKHKEMDIVLQSEDHKLRQPLEECVDFVL